MSKRMPDLYSSRLLKSFHGIILPGSHVIWAIRKPNDLVFRYFCQPAFVQDVTKCISACITLGSTSSFIALA
ncbi:hypothetical protein XELAEV_18006141mg [Xenopus laevis]|uniref:Uncharacterized protein n=1 Tax=Xenopus laevis TaxID=8355 RepID=A0A974I432_XENLA|nr:hypothetical protein XELAEV_18006141mg [Xenopus laevis]